LRYLYHIHQNPFKRRFGNKALGLKKLQRRHFPLPATWCIPAEARQAYDKDPGSFDRQFRLELEKHTDKEKRYAVRSSGELEDRASFSFAGQFATYLDVQGIEALLDAVHKVWDSANSVFEGAYMKQTGQSDDLKGMGVILQEMIDAAWSGVAFSINPVTGRSETIIEGVRGKGDKLVQEGVTPQRWIHHQGTWEPYDQKEAPPLELLQILVRDMPELRKIFRGDVDVEWAWDGKELWYLQCRRVSTYKFPTIYSNHISREVLPGMIKPLVWSVNNPLVNSAWIRLLSGMLGKLDVRPEELSEAFYYRAYFNMGTLGALFRMMGLPRDSLESLMGRKDPSGKSSFKPSLKTMRYLPSMLIFLLSNLNLGRKFSRKLPILNHKTDRLQKELAEMQPADFKCLYRRLYDLTSESAYWNIIIPLTMQITNRLLEKKLKKRGADISELEFTRDFPDLLDHDPNMHLDRLREAWRRFPEEQCRQISTYRDLEALAEGHPLKGFHRDLKGFIARFGHFSESGNDFSYEPWRENPDFLFELVRTSGKTDPSESLEPHPRASTRTIPKRAYQRAGRYRLYREMISSSYTRTYGLFRNLFLRTGHHLTEKNYLHEAGDVFYLSLEEHEQLLKGMQADKISGIQQKIKRVKEEMHSYRDITLPSVIYGETPPPIPAPDETVFKGIPTSPGIFTGQVVVVKGYQDFNKDVDGKILVIPFSDVGWTPILSRAAAIVAESGGILSHASIIARELAVPAISSVDHACTLKDGITARVDGYNGTLSIEP
jgi:pyruvate,water dikinase